MAACTKQEVDEVVCRVKAVVARFGGDSSEIDKLKRYYTMLYRLPEHFALLLCQKECERLETIPPQDWVI